MKDDAFSRVYLIDEEIGKFVPIRKAEPSGSDFAAATKMLLSLRREALAKA